jgi:acetyl esterase/lipase
MTIYALFLSHVLSSIVPNHCDSLPLLPCIALWPSGAVPNETDVPPTPNETRTDDDGHGCGTHRNQRCDHINDVSTPQLTPFLVQNGTGAAIVIAPGGGYHDLAWTKEGIDLARMYNKIGVSAFVLKYRVPARPDLPGLPKWWAPLQDAQRAVGLVRANAAKYGVNPSRVGFAGGSAGGHLTAHLSTAFVTRAYARVDSADDVSCRPDFSIFLYPWMLLPNNTVPEWGAAYTLASELDGMSKAHPPSLFVHNLDDPTAPPQGMLAYAQKLLALGAPKPVVHAYNKGGHGFGLCQGDTEWLEVCDWPKVAQRFLQDYGLAPGWPAQPADVASSQQLTQGCK